MTHDEEDFKLSSYVFDLPDEQIAQFPPTNRGGSRLLCLNRKTGEVVHSNFTSLGDFLPKNALLVANNSRVLHARLIGVRPSSGKVEFLLLTPLPLLLSAPTPVRGRDGWQEAEAEGLVRAGGRVYDGDVFTFGARIEVTIVEAGPFGQRRVKLAWSGNLADAFAAAGHIPLPPYIKRPDEDEDKVRYQTIFARDDKTGSIAAPTAGLHFTGDLRASLEQDGFSFSEITLYVGYGTFSPIRADDIRRHRMHREYVEVPESTADALAEAKKTGRPVVAVGTTSARALEGVNELCGKIQPFAGWTDIFIYPSRRFKVVDAMLTNFHLPESSLLVMVSAFAGRKQIIDAYHEAVQAGYQFFSYGDAMLIK